MTAHLIISKIFHDPVLALSGFKQKAGHVNCNKVAVSDIIFIRYAIKGHLSADNRLSANRFLTNRARSFII